MNIKKTFYPSQRLPQRPQKILGFVLVEVIASISILMLAVPAALTVASKSVFLAGYSKDQVIATHLAEEGIEIIRNKRDQNMFRGDTWTNGIWSGDCKSPNKCIVDPGFGASDPTIQKCVGGCSLVLNMDTASGAYAHQAGGTWAPTQFSRFVETSDVPGGGSSNEIRVSSVVTYYTHGISKTITLTENLTPWI